ncbi:hypothetical protein OGZ02_13365 [Brachyspira hyodysenteriae]|nr:hypothetical protein [Brachyspira hyodysenteriae]MDA1469797.1 hypothetical protein [Brachyspira hyodysenteriae]
MDIFTKKMFDELEKDFNGYNYRYKRDSQFKNRSIFQNESFYGYDDNKSFYKDDIKENFIKNIEYLYKLQSYTSYLVHNKMMDYNNIFIYTYHYVFMFDDIELAKSTFLQ